jgi:hypothetical protein
VLAKITQANRKRFLKAFSECGNIGESARRAKVARSLHYVWLRDPEYKQAFEEAGEHATDILVEEARRRAHDGWEEPVIYQGELQYQLDKQGNLTQIPLAVRKYDSTLLMFLIKGRRPEMYRENFKGEIVHTADVRVNHQLSLKTLNDEQLEQLEAMFRLDSGDDSSEP